MESPSNTRHKRRPYARPRTRTVLALAFALATAGSSLAQSDTPPCGSLDNPYGPFDYQTQRNRLDVVEKYHFTPEVEALVSGKSSAYAGGDLDYTLKAFPNHHRALLALVRLGEKLKSPQPQGITYPVECYFERALRFRPRDATARMLYATFLFRNQRDAQAQGQLELAASASGDNPFTHYNIGLIYFERQKYDLALLHAHKAYNMGFTQPFLRDQLKLRGRWKEPQ